MIDPGPGWVALTDEPAPTWEGVRVLAPLPPWTDASRFNGLLFSHDGAALLTGGAPWSRFDVASGRRVASLDLGSSRSPEGWRRPDGRTAFLGRVLVDLTTGQRLGESSLHELLAVSADGRTSLGHDGTHVAVERPDGARVTLPFERSVRAAALSFDGALAAVSLETGRVHICSGATGERIATLRDDDAAPAHLLAFSPDGESLVAGDTGGLELWSRAGWTRRWRAELVEPPRSRDEVLALAFAVMIDLEFSPDGETILLTSPTQLRSATTGALLWAAPPEIADGQCVAFSPDGARIAWGAAEVHVRDLASGTWVSSRDPMRAHSRPVRCFAPTPDGSAVWTAAELPDTRLALWEVETGRLQRALLLPFGEPSIWRSAPSSITLLDDGSTAVCGLSLDRSLAVDLDTSSPVDHPAGRFMEQTFGPGGEPILFPRTGEHRREKLAPLLHQPGWAAVALDPLFGASWPPDGLIGNYASKTIGAVSADRTRALHLDPDTAWQLLDVSTGVTTPLGVVAGTGIDRPGRGTLCGFAPDGRTAVVEDRAGDLHLWRLDDARVAVVITPPDRCQLVAFAGDSLVGVREDGGISVWSVETGELRWESPGVGSPARGQFRPFLVAAALVPDGRYVLTSGDDALLRRHDLEALARTYHARTAAQWVEDLRADDAGSPIGGGIDRLGAGGIALRALPRFAAADLLEQVPALTRALEVESDRVRAHAARALTIVAGKAREHHRVRAVLPVLRGLRSHDASSAVRRDAARAIEVIEGE